MKPQEAPGSATNKVRTTTMRPSPLASKIVQFLWVHLKTSFAKIKNMSLTCMFMCLLLS